MRQMFIKICIDWQPKIPSKWKVPEEFKELPSIKWIKEKDDLEDLDVMMIKETSEISSTAPSNLSKQKKIIKKNIKFA